MEAKQQESHAELQRQIEECTASLAQANAALQQEVAERQFGFA